MLKLLNDLPCETRSSIFEGETEEALIFKSTNLPTKVSFGLPQGWSAFDFFLTQDKYELLTSQYDVLARNGISYALVQETGALVVTNFPQSKKIPRMTSDDVRVVLRKCQTFMDACQQVVLCNKFDVLAMVDENCKYSQLAGVLWDLDHVVIAEVATNKRIFPTKSVVSPPSVFLHHGVGIPSDHVLNVARQLGAVKSSSTVKNGKMMITYEHMASAHLAAGVREFLPGKGLSRFSFGTKASDVYKGSEIPKETFHSLDTRVAFARANCFKKLTASALDMHNQSGSMDVDSNEGEKVYPFRARGSNGRMVRQCTR